MGGKAAKAWILRNRKPWQLWHRSGEVAESNYGILACQKSTMAALKTDIRLLRHTQAAANK